MSTPPATSEQESVRNFDDSNHKFTRGEKCLFTHLVITFSILLIGVIIFGVHLILVNHTKESLLKFSRRNMEDATPIERRGIPVGYLYLTTLPTGTCNALLLHKRWSVTPGHCAAMRSDPDMAYLLKAWRIKYRTSGMDYIESEIKRSIPHPHFDPNDFSNNIGLFEHVDAIDLDLFVYPESIALNDDDFLKNAQHVEMIGWEQDKTNDDAGPHSLRNYKVTAIAQDKCQRYMTPILDLRSYEFCVILKSNYEVYPEHGAILQMDSKIVGFFAWGERGGKGIPFILINILHYKEWLENMVSIAKLY